MILRLAVLLVSLSSLLAARHDTDTSYSRLRFEGDAVSRLEWTLRFDGHDLDRVFQLDSNRDGFVQTEEFEASLGRIRSEIEAGTSCRINGREIPFRAESSSLVDDPSGSVFLDLQQTIALDSSPRKVSIELALFDRFGEWHRHLLTLELGPEIHQDMLTFDRSRFTVTLDSTRPPLERAAEQLDEGFFGILLGPDQWLLLAAILLIARSRRELWVPALGWAGATVVAIGLGALEIEWLGERVLRSGMALSIVYLAVENLFAPAPAQRLPVAVLFGLVHGLAVGRALFSSGLSEFGRPWAVAGGWVGATTGLLVLLAVVWCLGRRWRGLPWKPATLMSVGVGLLGSWLFVDRFFGA